MANRFVILADVHLGTPETQFPGQNYTYAANVLRETVAAIAPLTPDHIVIVGDLVNMGTAEEYEIASTILSPLKAPIWTIPGNHELVRGSLEDFCASHRPAPIKSWTSMPARLASV